MHRVVVTTTSVINIEGAASFEDATAMATKQLELPGTGCLQIRTADVDDIKTFLMDAMGVAHDEDCPGTHCRHYGCLEESDEGERWYCTQCDTEDDD